MESAPSPLPELGYEFHLSPEATAAYTALQVAEAQLIPLSLAVQHSSIGVEAHPDLALAQDNYETALLSTADLYVSAYRQRGASDESIRTKIIPRLQDMYQLFATAQQAAAGNHDLSDKHQTDAAQLAIAIAETDTLPLDDAIDITVCKIGDLITSRAV